MEFTTCYCPNPQCTYYGTRRIGAHLVRRGADRGIPRLLCTGCKGRVLHSGGNGGSSDIRTISRGQGIVPFSGP